MSLKSKILDVFESCSFLRRLMQRATNQFKLHDNLLVVESVHFQKNTVVMDGEDQELQCEKNAYFRECRIQMQGCNNSVLVNADTSVCGGTVTTVLVMGDDNQIEIGKNCRLNQIQFFIRGNHNRIVIGDDCSAYNVELHVEQDYNAICIGKGTTMHGRDGRAIELTVDESSKITIGDDCMLSNNVRMRSTDSHSIVDLQGIRLNPAKDIAIGPHCWLSQDSTILKGAVIAEHCVVGACSVCSKEYAEPHSIIAGNPARIVKKDIDWDRKFV